jgi:hypothetical protein
MEADHTNIISKYLSKFIIFVRLRPKIGLVVGKPLLFEYVDKYDFPATGLRWRVGFVA